ncbi:MAG: DNA translocase FtsK [Planctomycetota bacterium JB042]
MDPTLGQATTDGTWFGAAPTIIGVLLAVFWAVLLFLKQPVERLHLRLIGLGCLVLVLSALLGYNGEGGRIGAGIATSLENTPLGGFAFFLLIVAALLSAPVATDWLFVPEITRWRSGQSLREAPVRGSVGRYQVRGGFMHDDVAPTDAAPTAGAGSAVLDAPADAAPLATPEPAIEPRIEEDELAERVPEDEPVAEAAATDVAGAEDEVGSDEEMPWYMRRRARRDPSPDDELADRREEPRSADRDDELLVADDGWGSDASEVEVAPAEEERAETGDDSWDGTWASEPVREEEVRDAGAWDVPAEADEPEVDAPEAEAVVESVDPGPEVDVATDEPREVEASAEEATLADDGWGTAPATDEVEVDEEVDEEVDAWTDAPTEEVEDVEAAAEQDEDEAEEEDEEDEEDEEFEDAEFEEDEAESDDEEFSDDVDAVDLAAEEEEEGDEEEEEGEEEEEFEGEEVALDADEDEEVDADEDEEVDTDEAEEVAPGVVASEEAAADPEPAPARREVAPEDALYFQAGDLVVSSQRASISFLQRSLGIGYFQAAKLLDRLQGEAVIGPYTGAVNRDVLMTVEAWESHKDA